MTCGFVIFHLGQLEVFPQLYFEWLGSVMDFSNWRAVWSPLPACSERLGEIWEASYDPSSGWWSMMVRVVHFLFRFMGSSRLYSAMALPGRCLTPVAESVGEVRRYGWVFGGVGGVINTAGAHLLEGRKLDVNIGWFGEIWCWVVLGNVWAKTLFNMEPPSKIRILEIAGDSDSFWISTNRLQVFSIPQSLGIRGKMPLAATTSIKWSDDKCTIPKQTVLLKKDSEHKSFFFIGNLNWRLLLQFHYLAPWVPLRMVRIGLGKSTFPVSGRMSSWQQADLGRVNIQHFNFLGLLKLDFFYFFQKKSCNQTCTMYHFRDDEDMKNQPKTCWNLEIQLLPIG